jgi:hypothetical protein
MSTASGGKKKRGAKDEPEAFFVPASVPIMRMSDSTGQVVIEKDMKNLMDFFEAGGQKNIVTLPKLREKVSPEKQAVRVQHVAKLIRNAIEEMGVEKWEISVEGNVEVGTGDFIPGGSASVKATLKLMSK